MELRIKDEHEERNRKRHKNRENYDRDRAEPYGQCKYMCLLAFKCPNVKLWETSQNHSCRPSNPVIGKFRSIFELLCQMYFSLKKAQKWSLELNIKNVSSEVSFGANSRFFLLFDFHDSFTIYYTYNSPKKREMLISSRQIIFCFKTFIR